MFPVRSDLGNAQVDTSGNDMNEVIQAGKDLALFNRDVLMPSGNRPYNQSGIQDVGNMGRSAPLQFGGANYLPDPYGKPDTSLYDSYKQPQVTPEVGMSNDNKLFMQRQADNNIDTLLDRRVKEQNIRKSEFDMNSKGSIVNVASPYDNTKTISGWRDNATGSVTPLKMDGTILETAAQGRLNAADAVLEKKADFNRDAYLNKTNQSLAVIKDLMDDTGNLTAEGARAVGLSSIGNFLPTTLGYSGGKKINKLRNEQVLDLIKELKEQSRTGATGMGNMSNKDLSVINNAATLLDTGLSEEEFTKQLKIVKDELKDIALRLNSEKLESGSKIKETAPMVNIPLANGRIKVRNKVTGELGTVSEAAFNSTKYDRVQ